MAFTALTPMKLMTTQKIVVKICTKCYPNLIKRLENTGKFSFTSPSEALPSCPVFMNSQMLKGIMWISSVANWKYSNYRKKI